MKRHLILIVLCICSVQTFYSQEDDGVVSLAIPSRNSMTFNRYTMNPTFSFVREQTKYISIFSQREWIQFDNAPTTYLASYSGRFGENIGGGLGVFQQNYGVLTTFGGILNFAYNVRLGADSNLTFGLNVGAYKSGVNTANVVTNSDDPSIQNVPENFLLTVNPGINYGLEFLDFGVSLNNLVLYNFESSAIIEDNQEQSIQAHIMYTGYMDSKGFFDDSKFTGLLKSEFFEDRTIISVKAMVTVPKGLWAQLGYNAVNGGSVGVGINLTKQIAIEYNFETTLGDLNILGPSHDITLAYRFKNHKYYDYSREDEVSSVFANGNKKRNNSKPSKSKVASKKPNNKAEVEAQAKRVAQEESKLQKEAEEKAEAQIIAEGKAKQLKEEKLQAELIEEQKAKEQAKIDEIEADKKAKEIAATKLRIQAEQKAKEKSETAAKLLAEQKAKEDAEKQAKLIEEQKAKEQRESQARIDKIEADKASKLLEEQKAQQEAEQEARLLEVQNAIKQREAQTKLDSAEAELLEAQKANEEAVANPKDELSKSMQSLAKSTKESKAAQNELLKQFEAIIATKDEDLKYLKEENDLSDQGIASKPRPFKSVTAENNTLNGIKADLETAINARSKKIEELNDLYKERVENKNFAMDEVTLFYKKEIERLESEQLIAKNAKEKLEVKLVTIRIATEFEKRRRIKRASFSNEDDRYNQDRATLNNIKKTTSVSETPLKEEDFDFGEELGNNIQILKNIKNVENGYYIIIAVHDDTKRRNEFLTKVLASGRSDVNFFYDVNTSKYYIYYDKFDNINNANNAIKSKGSRPYNGKMSIVKIEN